MAERSGSDGRDTESLVATIEGLLVPQGFTVEKRERVYEDGVQVAELDITIRGKVGSASITWLIECRDRPSEGPAPVAWIEQLVGRRSHHKFDKVTAVSTFGFTHGAVTYARREGIDLREVNEVGTDVVQWIATTVVHSTEVRHMVEIGNIHLSHDDGEEHVKAAFDVIDGQRLDAPILRSTQTDQTVSVADAFQLAVGEHRELLAGLQPGDPARRLRLSMEYPLDDSHFVVDTPLGPVRVRQIDFEGDVSIITTDVPLSKLAEYKHVGGDKAVAQAAGFQFEVKGQKISLDFHHLIDDGRTRVSLRRLSEPTPGPRPER